MPLHAGDSSVVKAMPRAPPPSPRSSHAPADRPRPLASRFPPPAPARSEVSFSGSGLRLPLKMPPRRLYSNQEYLEMVLCYRECNSVTAHAVNLYQLRFGVRVSHHTILDAVYRFREHGRFDPPPVDAGRPPYSAHLEEEVLDFFRRHPLASTRAAARVFDVSDNYV